jgi:hypothetical protein
LISCCAQATQRQKSDSAAVLHWVLAFRFGTYCAVLSHPHAEVNGFPLLPGV